MAEGLLNHFCSERFHAESAGVTKTHVHPLALQVMEEIDIDISHHRSKQIDQFKHAQFDYVVTVCDSSKETCPFFPGKHVINKGFTDPPSGSGSFEDKVSAFRIIRDEIKSWVMTTFCESQEDSSIKDYDTHV
jgi:arsenate reductase